MPREKMQSFCLLLVGIFIILSKGFCGVLNGNSQSGLLDIKSSHERNSSILVKVIDNSHHLFIGRCKPQDEILHGENIILNNDGRSHASGSVQVHVNEKVYITCVKILDLVPDGEGGYPTFVDGGVGHNYVIFNVTTHYGKGFNFYVEINGYIIDDEDSSTTPNSLEA